MEEMCDQWAQEESANEQHLLAEQTASHMVLWVKPSHTRPHLYEVPCT